jgi:DNA-directed RNA polymerase subunit RPC12/RpoP
MEEILEETKATPLSFECPKCGTIPQDQVIFLCNHCSEEELILKDGVFVCPACLLPGENFECANCGSKEVKLSPKDRSALGKSLSK